MNLENIIGDHAIISMGDGGHRWKNQGIIPRCGRIAIEQQFNIIEQHDQRNMRWTWRRLHIRGDENMEKKEHPAATGCLIGFLRFSFISPCGTLDVPAKIEIIQKW